MPKLVVDAHRLIGPVPFDDLPEDPRPDLARLGVHHAYVTHTLSLYSDVRTGDDAPFALTTPHTGHPAPPALSGLRVEEGLPALGDPRVEEGLPALAGPRVEEGRSTVAGPRVGEGRLVPASSRAGGEALPGPAGPRLHAVPVLLPETFEPVPSWDVRMVRLCPARHRFDLTGPITLRWLSALDVVVAIDLDETSPAELRAQGGRGHAITSQDDLTAWMTGRPDEEPCTFVVDAHQTLRLAPRRSEHVACAGGEPVLGSGEISFARDGDGWLVHEISNQSTGYCPDVTSWAAVETALTRAGLPHPGGFTHPIVFRRCPGCRQRNIVKDGHYVCAVCDTPLPRAWNVDQPD